MLNDGRDDYLLTIHTHDHEVSVDGGRPVQVAAGEAVRSQFRLPGTIVKVLSLSRKKLRGLTPRTFRLALTADFQPNFPNFGPSSWESWAS